MARLSPVTGVDGSGNDSEEEGEGGGKGGGEGKGTKGKRWKEGRWRRMACKGERRYKGGGGKESK